MSNHWKDTHQYYKTKDWIVKPSIFAESVMKHFPLDAKLLDLGTGQGQDALFFASNNFEVTAVDSSDQALEFAKDSDKQSLVNFVSADISQKLPFEDSSFDIVYSHLALHYFDTETTKRLFQEINRVLKPEGVLAFLVNSISDPEISEAEEVEENYFKLGSIYKRYFDVDSALQFAKDFETLLVDEKGETYKDKAIGVSNLIRYVGKKK
jgi:ubiquinone/menaquinone biosynthesis C-methylase UbiE